ncbi:N-6 DNA methylase, partial [Acidobacteria bacterium AH-259-D05]|nr:N-6 DNA methylase [Acidobacteria bacterium AH-259-D05]
LEPEVDVDAGSFDLTTVGGHERKTTGSYYTPSSLVNCLLDSALDPVLEEAAQKPEPEQSILSLKVCDPACGSGHFLIAAAHRIAKRLAAVRTGDEEPSPEATRTALRDVIGHCIYGVDVNPMAAELCKVALWMEAIDPGKALSFLDHKIQCGNSLLGTTPKLLAEGIPDDAFKPIEGDDRKFAAALKKRNKQERKGQRTMWLELAAERIETYGSFSDKFRTLDVLDDASIGAVHEKEERYHRLAESAEYQRAKLVADAWCAAFVWEKRKDLPEAVTTDVFRSLEVDPAKAAPKTIEEIKRLAGQYRLFHWHLAFPEVFQLPVEGHTPENGQSGWSGGFDAVLGNPPWDQLQFREQEFFTSSRPDIAEAKTGAQRKRMIAHLASGDSQLYTSYLQARRSVDGTRFFVASSGRFPFCGRGRMNTFALFAETNWVVVSSAGRVGCIVPSGIATDDTTKHFFHELIQTRSLVSLFDFENRARIFRGVDSRMKFCLLTFVGSERAVEHGAEFIFFAHFTQDVSDEERRFKLSADDIVLVNPNTRTCPIFRTSTDARITKEIYCRFPILIREDDSSGNTWGLITKPGLFNMTGDSQLFYSFSDLQGQGGVLSGNIFIVGEARYLPLYEGKMVHFYDHRFASVVISDKASLRLGQPQTLSIKARQSPHEYPIPRFWVASSEVEKRLQAQWTFGWILGWKEVTAPTNERTLIPTIFPRYGIGHKIPIALPSEQCQSGISCLLSCLSSYVCDFIARQKLGTTSLTPFTFKQLPVPTLSAFRKAVRWAADLSFKDWLIPRVLELVYTAWDLELFARDHGYCGPPFCWDETRRFILRSELDAAYFHLICTALVVTMSTILWRPFRS